MAVSNKEVSGGGDHSSLAAARGRRLVIGANVVVVTLIAAALVGAVNWISHKQHWRKDVASTGQYGLSDRTKKIINDCPVKEISLTAVYTSTDKEKDRDKYLPRIRDLFDEMESFSGKVKVTYLTDDDQKRELVARIHKKFSGKGKDYQELIDLAKAKWADLGAWIQQTTQQFDQLAAGKAWLAGFYTFAKMSGELARDAEDLQQTQREVDEAVTGIGLPRYEQAKQKIEQFNTKVKGHLDEAQKWLADLEKTAAVLRDPKGDFATKTAAQLGQMKTLVAELRKAIGDPKDESIPDDPTPALKDFSRAAGKLSQWLAQEATRVDEFADAHKAIAGHRLWVVQINQLMQMEVTEILAMNRNNLAQVDAQVRQVLTMDQPKDVLQNAVRQLRRMVANLDRDLGTWDQQIRHFLADWQKIDEVSLALLQQAKENKWAAAQLEGVKAIEDKIKALPELKLEDTATKFEQDNIVTVETEDQVQVVDFDQMWPKSDPFGPSPASENADIERRIFNGDAAISAAVLALGHKEPFATVIITSFEPSGQPNPMQQQPPQPRPGRIPSAELTKLRERLEQANFKVKNWNLATEEKAPEPEKGTKPIYVFLPPAEAPQQNPFQRMPQDQKTFGEPELKKVREVLGQENARGIFLCCFLPPRRSFFGSQPSSYGYDSLLRDDWGIDVKYGERVIRGVPDKQDVNRYGLSITRWNWMRLNTFEEKNPIGSPLRSRRCLFVDVCPVLQAAKVPEGVKIETILGIPGTTGRSEFWAEGDIERLIMQIRSTTSDGTVVKGDKAIDPPFTVILAAENQPKKSKVIVNGAGLGVVDDYMGERVPRLGREERISFDPPPRENGDLFVNMAYALADKPDFIAAGPIIAPSIEGIGATQKRNLYYTVVAWALVVGGAGVVMTVIRRK